MRTGVRLGVDVGKVRVGVAVCDRDGLVATPVATLTRGVPTVTEIVALLTEYEAVEAVVGLPLSLRGDDTASTADARLLAAELAALAIVPVRMVDERLSTVSAQRALHQSGRSAKGSRAVIDQVAAVIILQNALDAERSSGRPPGILVEPNQGRPTA
ncbi:MAG: Holliday junction resolvase RuvX [Acidobacteria bacterium]|nr:Holliday junction resolvase RuvX [Acidobacteriota bacterium]